MSLPRPRPMALVAAMLVVVGIAFTVVTVGGGDHANHRSVSPTRTTSTLVVQQPSDGENSEGANSSSSALRVGLFVALTGGWATAFIVGIWRRWRITDDERGPLEPDSADDALVDPDPPDYDKVSEVS